MTEAEKGHDQAPKLAGGETATPETLIDRLVEGALLRTLLGNPVRRRQFLQLTGSGTAAALLSSVLPLDAAKALAQEKPGPIEKKDLKVGFIFKLSKDLWPNHADCAFACSQEFATTYPNTFHALVRALVDATHFSAKAENRREIAKAIAPKNYLNQPVEVIEAVLTGNYEDGLGGRWNIPDRVNFDPYPWKSFGVWILTQLKRWGYLKGGVDYRQIVDEVFQTALTGRIARELGYEAPTAEYKQEPLFAGAFDPEKPEEYLASFAIRRS